jgi:hypothetical protein
VRIYSEVELQEKIAGAREKAREAREKSESKYTCRYEDGISTCIEHEIK